MLLSFFFYESIFLVYGIPIVANHKNVSSGQLFIPDLVLHSLFERFQLYRTIFFKFQVLFTISLLLPITALGRILISGLNLITTIENTIVFQEKVDRE